MDFFAKRKLMKFSALKFMLFAAILFGVTAQARTFNVERELEATDLVLERVEDLFPEEPSSSMIQNFELAASMQAEAHDAYDRGEHLLAMNLTRQAREIALRVERMILALNYKPPEGPPNMILRILEQCEELIEELTPTISEYPDQVILTEFDAAVEMHSWAWDQFLGENYSVSGQLAQVARDRLLKLRVITQETMRRNSPELARNKIELAREALANAKGKLIPEALEAAELLELAEGILSEAERFLDNARYREALRLIDEVIVLSNRSLEVSKSGGLSAGRFDEEFARTEELIDKTYESFDDSTPPEARELAEKAMNYLIESQLSMTEGNPVTAVSKLLEARRIADLAARSAAETGDINRWNVEKGLNNTDRIIERIQAPVESSNSNEAKRFLEKALELQNQAKSFFERENYKEALNTSRAAADAANQAIKTAEKR